MTKKHIKKLKRIKYSSVFLLSIERLNISAGFMDNRYVLMCRSKYNFL